jgi:aryl-alcohol dehydrogenase-like predicted oxidoreductase
MKTDYLDLWQVHYVRTEVDIKRIFGPAGALEAFVEAKEDSLVRFIGVPGHHDPSIIKWCFDFDTVLLPVNPVEPHYKSFLDEVVPVANEKGMGIIGMKVFLRGVVVRPFPLFNHGTIFFASP